MEISKLVILRRKNILVTYIIHEKGIVKSISATVKARTNGLIGKYDEMRKETRQL